MILALQTLISKNACSEQVRLFKKLFGQSVDVTPQACLLVAERFDWEWVAKNLLPAPAWKLYEETCAPAWKLYEETCAPAFADAYNHESNHD